MFGGMTIWLALSILIGYWASKLGREGVVWGLIAALISPLLAAICLLIIGDSNEKLILLMPQKVSMLNLMSEIESGRS